MTDISQWARSSLFLVGICTRRAEILRHEDAFPLTDTFLCFYHVDMPGFFVQWALRLMKRHRGAPFLAIYQTFAILSASFVVALKVKVWYFGLFQISNTANFKFHRLILWWINNLLAYPTEFFLSLCLCNMLNQSLLFICSFWAGWCKETKHTII